MVFLAPFPLLLFSFALPGGRRPDDRHHTAVLHPLMGPLTTPQEPRLLDNKKTHTTSPYVRTYSPTPPVSRVKVVDNNDDIESEDDNDSELPEALPGNADADLDTDLATLSSPRDTPPDPSKGANTRPSIESGIGQLDVGTTLVLTRRVSGSGGHGGSGRAGNTAGVGNRARECDESYSDMMGHERARGWGLQTAADNGGGDNGGGCGGEGSHPWPGVGWEQGEVGRSGEAVRRWGRAVKEIDGDDESAIESAELEGLAIEQPPPGQAVGKRVELRRGDSVKYAGVAIGGDGNRWTGRGKGCRRSSTRERGSVGASGAEAMAPVAVNTSCTVAASGNPVGGEPPPSGRRKEKRRGSGSRNAKHAALGNGKTLVDSFEATSFCYYMSNIVITVACTPSPPAPIALPRCIGAPLPLTRNVKHDSV